MKRNKYQGQCPTCKSTTTVSTTHDGEMVETGFCCVCGINIDLEPIIDKPPSSAGSLPGFTCDEIGGVYAIWWGDGSYLWGFGLGQKYAVEGLVIALNDKLLKHQCELKKENDTAE